MNDHYKERSEYDFSVDHSFSTASFVHGLRRKGKIAMEMAIQICKSKQERLVLGLCLVVVLIVQNNHALTMDNIIFLNTTSTFRLNYNQATSGNE